MRNKMVFQRIASLLCVFVLLFSSLPSFAEETFTVTEPTPQEQQTEEAPQPVETIVVATEEDQENQNDQPQAEETEAPQEPQAEAPALAPTASLKNTGDSALFGVMLTSSKKNGTLEFTDENEYSAIAVTGTYKKNAPTVSRISADAPDGVTVLEAWAVDGMSGNTALEAELTLNALPETAWNEEIAVYSVKDGRAYELLADAIDVGGSVRLSLKHNKETGIALVKVGTGETLAPDSAIWANDALYLTGKMPGNAVVEATPVSVEIDGRAALSAYDIKIYANANQQAKGKPWKPAADKVTVHFYNADFNDAKGTLSVYHMETASDAPELVADNMTADNGWIEFDAASFSVYAVAGVIEKDVQIGNDVYHVTVEYDSDSGVPDGVILEVREIQADTDAYAAYRSRAAETLNLSENSILFARVLDISLKDPETLQDIPLNNSVRVSVELKQDVFQEDADIAVVHFAKPAEAPLDNQDISLPGQGTADTNQSEGSAPAADAPASDYDDVPTLVASTVSGNTVAFDTDGFSVYVVMETVLNKTVTTGDGETYEISVKYSESAGIPMTGTALAVSEMLPEDADYEDFVREAVIAAGGDTESIEYSKVFDIKIVDENDPSVVYEPTGAVEVSIRLIGETLDEYTNLDVMHFVDDGLSDGLSVYQLDSGIKGEVIQFSTNSFSVYVIVAAPPAITPEPTDVKTLADIVEDQGYKFCITRQGFTSYMTGNAGREQTYQFYGDTDENNAEVWYFESTSDSGKFYIYRLNGLSIEYIYVYDTQKMRLDTSDKTVFTVEENTNSSVPDSFYIYEVRNSKKYALSVRGNKDFFLEQRDNGANTNECVIISKAVAIPRDPYGLDGKTFGIAYHEESVKGAGLMSSTATNGKLDALELLVRPDVLNSEGELLISKSSDLTDWTFSCIEGNKYYITTQVGGVTKYLTLASNGVFLLDEHNSDSEIIVETDSAYPGKYRFVGTKALFLSGGKASGGFTSSNEVSRFAWLNLVRKSSDLNDSDFTVYSAEKVDLSNNTQVKDGDEVIIYTRVWNNAENDADKGYNFYVLNYDGTLTRCYESGDVIQWVGSNVQTAEWKFSEYYYDPNADPKVPNYYYDLQNTYSGKYIAPQVTTGQIVSNNPIGININGRRYGYVYSQLIAWDTQNYSYVGLKAKDDFSGVEASEVGNAGEAGSASVFYFAKIKNNADILSTIATIRHKDYNITMKMVDLDNGGNDHNGYMSQFLGSNEGGTVKTTQPNLLSTELVDNYPVAAGGNLSALYAGAVEVDYLFTENTYYSSGYFEYDSSHNFASFYDKEGNYNPYRFTVYSQLASYDSGGNGVTRKHGQFFPYNKIDGEQAVTNGLNLYDIHGNELPDSNPRKGDPLYILKDGTGNKNIDPYFAMEMEASFTQTVSGKDAWGHDIIYEFTGDDDFWLYVDGELVIDLGGIHSALSGSVNFATGTVIVNGGTPTDLKEIFSEHYKAKYKKENGVEPTEEEINTYLTTEKNFEEDEPIFKEYTDHTMRIFYMERGAGASNLKMRFNLAAVKPGTVELSKEVTGVEKTGAFIAEYPYQIFYKVGDREEQQLSLLGETGGITTKYKNTDREVKFKKTFTAADGQTQYNDVFMLQPGEVAVISFPDDTTEYRVVECFVDTSVYNQVSVNSDSIYHRINENETYTIIEDPELSRDVYLRKINPSTGIVYNVLDDIGNQIPVENRKDIDSGTKKVDERTRITFYNHVDPEAKGTLIFTKRLYEENGTTPIAHENDDSIFTFRLYLGTENDGEIPLANMYNYHVKDNHGYYCRWANNEIIGGASHTGFVSLNTQNFEELSAADKELATFTTSMNGMTDKIPVDYTIEVDDIPAGTKYMVEERFLEIPDGYSLQNYVPIEQDTAGGDMTVKPDKAQKNPVSGTIANGMTSGVEIRNIKGWGLRVYKKWSDAEWMETRDPVYFQLYVNNEGTLTPVKDSVKQLAYGDGSVYWFIETMKYDPVDGYYVANKDNGTSIFTLENFEAREVVLTSTSTPTVNSQTGAVSGSYSISYTLSVNTSVNDVNTQFTVNGKQKDEQNPDAYTYKFVQYTKGTQAVNGNVREDNMFNKRQGIDLYLTTWDSDWNVSIPLAGGVFTLTDSTGANAGQGTFTSDESGLITIAYLRNGETYTLTQTASPTGYIGLQTPLKITKNADNTVTVTNEETSWEEQDEGGNVKYGVSPDRETWWMRDDEDIEAGENIRYGRIVIKNKPFALQIKKTQYTEDGAPLSDTRFALYREVIDVNGNLRKDYLPITDPDDYSELVTGADGLVPQITEDFADGTLVPGTYYLYEKGAVDGYRPLSSDVKFTLNATGKIIVDSSSPDNVKLTQTGTGFLTYTIVVPNELAGKRTFTVRKTVVNETTADINGTNKFNFIVKVYLPDGRTPWNYSDSDFINGSTSFALSHNGIKELEVPLGAVLDVYEESYPTSNTNAYSTVYKLNNGDSVSGRRCITTITDDAQIEYINTRQLYNVNVKKQVTGSGGTFTFTATLTDNGVLCNSYTLNTANNIITGDGTGGTDSGKATFTISVDADKISRALTLKVPYGTNLVITEVEDENYTTKIGQTETNVKTFTNITLNNQSVTFTNEIKLNYPAPTWYGEDAAPFAVLLASGALLALVAGLRRRKRRE